MSNIETTAQTDLDQRINADHKTDFQQWYQCCDISIATWCTPQTDDTDDSC